MNTKTVEGGMPVRMEGSDPQKPWTWYPPCCWCGCVIHWRQGKWLHVAEFGSGLHQQCADGEHVAEPKSYIAVEDGMSAEQALLRKCLCGASPCLGQERLRAGWYCAKPSSPAYAKSFASENCICGHSVSVHEWEDEFNSCCMAHLRIFAGVGEGKPCMCTGFMPKSYAPLGSSAKLPKPEALESPEELPPLQVALDNYSTLLDEVVRLGAENKRLRPSADAPVEELDHKRNCAAWKDVHGYDAGGSCTCGLRWRVMLQTEQAMHAAWRKRAEESESELAAFRENKPAVEERTQWHCDYENCSLPHGHIQSCNELDTKTSANGLRAALLAIMPHINELPTETYHRLAPIAHAALETPVPERTAEMELLMGSLREFAKAAKEASEDDWDWRYRYTVTDSRKRAYIHAASPDAILRLLDHIEGKAK